MRRSTASRGTTLPDRFEPHAASRTLDRIDRGRDFIASPFVQFEVYREAVFIFYGKLSVYLKTLGRDPGEHWAMGIG